MAWFKQRKKTASRKRTTKSKSAYWASPAGKHRALALTSFKTAKKARSKGNLKAAKVAYSIGQQALALSKKEYSMWKRGKVLRSKALKVARA